MTTQEFEKAVTAFVLAYRTGELRADSVHMDNGYDEWLEENMDKFESEDEEKDFANWKSKDGMHPRNCDDVDEVDALWKEYSNREDGGPGSGNHGHEGVPGQRGGSAPSGETTDKGENSPSYPESVGKDIRNLLDRHTMGGDQQADADYEIAHHIARKDTIGKAILEKSVSEEQAWKEQCEKNKKDEEERYEESIANLKEATQPGGYLENYSMEQLEDMGLVPAKPEYVEPMFYRKGELGGATMSFSTNPNGANMSPLTNGEEGEIGYDHAFTMSEIKDMGYVPIAGIKGFDVGMSGESEVMFAAKEPTEEQLGALKHNPVSIYSLPNDRREEALGERNRIIAERDDKLKGFQDTFMKKMNAPGEKDYAKIAKDMKAKTDATIKEANDALTSLGKKYNVTLGSNVVPYSLENDPKFDGGDSSKMFTEYREGRRYKEDEQRADDEWITINGTHVMTDKDGNLKGSVGEKISSTSKSHKSSSGKGGGKNSLSPDEFDKYVSENGSQVLYRGFSAPSEEAVKEYASSIKNGESPVSGEKTSALGKGVYFTPKKEEAEGYVTRRQQEKGESHGRVVTAALDKDAKIADQNEINRLTQQKFEEASEMMGRAFKVMRAEGEEAGEKLGEEANALMKMDVASYAATKGYDALQAYDGTIVVMNQKKLLVRDDSKDIMPEEVFFQEDDEGNIWAIRGREVIGEVSEDDLAKGGFQTDEGWITVNGTHILTDKEGNLTGKIGEKISATSKGSKGGSGEKKLSEEMTPKQTGYDIDLEEGYQDFVRKNMGTRRNPKLLYDLYHKAEDEGKDGVEEVKDEYHKTRLAMCTKDLKEISKDEADEILYDNLRPGTVQAWFREYNHEAKDALVAQLTRSPEVHNAALNIMYDNYKYQCQDEGKEPLPYDKFLVTPIKMYRGGTGKEYDTAGTFSSYTFNRGVAEKFTGGDVGQAASYDPNGVVYEAEIRPIDTYGSVFSNGEAEICVPRMIAPNKNRDSAADSADIKETPQDWRTHRRRPRGKTSLWGRLYIIGNEYLQKKLLDMAGRHANVTIEGNKTQRSDDSPSAWITLENGAHIPLGESGEALGGAGGWAKGKDFSGAEGSGKEKGYSDKPSATGANKPCTGFKNKYLAKRHQKHWDEFGVSSREEYEKLAIDFIKQPVGGDIDGYMRETGEIVRFNRKTGELGIGRPGKEVVTFFKARYDKKSGKVKLNAAVNYFNKLKELEAA